MKKIAYIIISLVAAATLFSARLQAQTNPIYFPYLVNDSQSSTALALTNVAGRDANVSLTAYREDGSAASQVSVRVPASSQVIVGPATYPNLRGWVLGSSDVPGVVGNLQVFSSNGSAVETSDAASADSTIVFPFVAETSGGSTEISLVNPSPVNARLILTIYARDGKALATNDSLIGPFAVIRRSVSSLFGSVDYTNASHVVARYIAPNIFSQPVNFVGFELVRGFVRISDDPTSEKILTRTDWAALPAVPASGAVNSLTFPHVTRDQGWFSLIGVVNIGDTSQTVTLSYATATNPNAGTRTISIPANGSLRQSAIDLFGAGQDSGSVRVTASGNLTGFIGVGTLAGSGFATASVQSKAQSELMFPVVDETGTSITGIGLLNDGTVQASVDLFLISAQGTTVGQTTQLLLPRQRSVKLVRDFFLEGLNFTSGYVYIRSSAPIFGTAVSGVPDKTLSAFTSQSNLPGFTPAPQSLFVIRGQIKDNGAGTPVTGVSVNISKAGAGVTTTTTDGNGQFVFTRLVSGEYTVSASQAGRMFAPLSPVVRVTTANEVVDFTRDIMPTISALTVVTNDAGAQMTAGNNPDAFAIFGTSEVSLKISGSSFVAGQTVFFGTSAVPAANVNFVDSKTIYAKLVLNSTDILSELAARGYYGSYNITVGGPSPFTDVRSNALPFYILPPLPVLTSVTSTSGTAQTYARYEIDSSGETLTVTGYGFRSGAQILFDGHTSVNGIELDTKFISSTQLQVYLPPQALRYGGIYNLRVRNVSQLPEVSGEAVTFQVNNLRPEITSIDPAGPIPLIGPGTTPIFIDLTINGTNFHPAPPSTSSQDPGTLTAVTLKIPDIFPGIVPVGGQQQCIIINSRGILRVRVFNSAGQPVGGIPVTFTTPGIDVEGPSGYFQPGGQNTVTVTTDAQGFAPPLTSSSVLFQANPIAGGYTVKISATVDGLLLKGVFNMTNLNPGDTCTGPGRPTIRFISSTQLVVTEYPIVSRGTYSVVVANSSPGGGVSREVEFVVTAGPTSGVPTIRTTDPLSPASRPAGSSAFNLTVFRDTSTSIPFQTDAWVNFGTVRLNRISGDTSIDSITVSVPSFLVASPGTVPVSVTNPGTSGSTGGTSNRVLFTVQ